MFLGLDGENTQENPSPQGDTQNQAPSPPSLPHQSQGAVTKAKGEAAEAEVEAGAKAIKEKESGIAFSTKRMMTTPQTIAQTRKGLRLSSKKKIRRKRGTIL
jgi:hypothetical protein